MNHKIKLALLAIFSLVLLVFISGNAFAMPNPAANFCIGQGNVYEIKTDAQGNEYGVCVTDGSKVKDAWDFYRQKQDLSIASENAKKKRHF